MTVDASLSVNLRQAAAANGSNRISHDWPSSATINLLTSLDDLY
jgi:hypothetical protein